MPTAHVHFTKSIIIKNVLTNFKKVSLCNPCRTHMLMNPPGLTNPLDGYQRNGQEAGAVVCNKQVCPSSWDMNATVSLV